MSALPAADPPRVSEFHAHIYYDADTRAHAQGLRTALEQDFAVRMGRWRETPVGPHPKAMYQVAFDPAQFGAVVPYLMLHRGPLDILVHPETGLGHAGDHSVRALWLGRPQVLDLAFLDAIDAGRLSV